MATKEEIKQNIRDDLNGLPGWDLTSPYQRITPLIDSIVDEIYDNVDAKENIISFYNPTSGLPAAPALFDRYVASATGNGWTQRYIYEWDGTQWIQTIPEEGFLVWVENEDMFYVFNGTNWINLLLTSGFEPAITPGTIYQVFFGDKVFRDLATTVVAEGTNLYYTNVRVAAYGDTRYSQLGHNHNDLYSQLGHSHDYSSIYAPINHNHTGAYAGVIHSHTHTDITDFASYTQTVCDALYSPLGHIHDTRYSLLNHDHTGVYEPVINRGTTAQYFRGDLTLATMPTSMPSPHALTLGTGLTGSSYNGSAAVTAAVSYGSTAGTSCQGNDSRLSDARTPLAHTHDDRYYTETESDARYSQLGHGHSHTDLSNLNSTSYYHLTSTQYTDLTDGGDSSLHYHLADRAATYSGLTSGVIPYYNGTVFANSPLSVSGSNVTSSGYLFGTTSLRSGTSTTGVLEITPYLFGYGVNYKSFTISHDGTVLLDSSKIGTSFDSYWTGTFHATSFVRGAYTVWDAGNLTGDQTGHYHSADRSAVFSGLTSGYIPYYNGTAFANSVLSQVNSQLCSSNNINLGNQNDPSTDQGNTWITWGYRSDLSPYYAIRTDRHVYTVENQNRLQIGWHTGVEIGASSTYGGTRFFNNSPFVGTQIMSIGDGDNHVRVLNNMLTGGIVRVSGSAPTTYGVGTELIYDASWGGVLAYDRTNSVYKGLALNNNVYILGSAGSNVGIGTSTPNTTLDVRGIFSISNANGVYWGFDRSDANGSLEISESGTVNHIFGTTGQLWARSSIYSDYGCYARNDAGYGSYIGVFKYQGALPGSSYVNSSFPVLKTDDANIYIACNNKYVGFIGEDQFGLNRTSDTTLQVYLCSSGKSYLNGGDVGILTNNPQYNLHVNGTFYAITMSRAGYTVWDAGNLTGVRDEHKHIKLWRSDSANDYYVSHLWDGTYWHLRGYTSAGNYHAPVHVGYADNAASAASATNADTIDGLHAESFFNNMGAAHASYHSFDTLPAYGCRFLQGSINGPIASQNDYYGFTIGLGSDYQISQYASQLYWKRNSHSYMYMRFREGGVWGNWNKVGAGYSDDATHAYNSDAISNISIGNATANRLVRYNSAATQFVSSLIVDDGTNLGMYSTGYAAMTAGANIGLYVDVTEGGIGFVGDVVTNFTMANGTYAKLHNAKIDYGNYNEITGLYNQVTTININSYATSHFLINAPNDAIFTFVGATTGQPIFVSNNNNGGQALIQVKTNDLSRRVPIAANQTFMLWCEYTDGSTIWVWRVFNSLTTGV